MKGKSLTFIITLLSLMVFLIANALTNPHTARASGPDAHLVLVMDVSSSVVDMIADHPSALADIHAFISGLPHNVSQLSLLTFRGDVNSHFESLPMGNANERMQAASEAIRAIRDEMSLTRSGMGTNIGLAMADAAKRISGSEFPVMLLVTDAIISRSHVDEYDGHVTEMNGHIGNGLTVHILELYNREITSGERKADDLEKIALDSGGIRRVQWEITKNGLAEDLVSISEAIAGREPEPETTNEDTEEAEDPRTPNGDQPVYQNEPIPTQPPAPDTINIVMKTNEAITGKPLIETGMFAGNDLVIHGQIEYPGTDGREPTVESSHSVYEFYNATLYIIKEGDTSFRTSEVRPRESLYRISMTLPEEGQYRFFIVLSSPDGWEKQSEEQIITVYPVAQPRSVGVSAVEIPPTDEFGSTTLEIRVNLFQEKIAGLELYYHSQNNPFTVHAYIKAKSSREDFGHQIMRTDGNSFFAAFELEDDGTYIYYIEIEREGVVVYTLPIREITVTGLATVIAIALLAAAGVLLAWAAVYIAFMPHRYDFIISVTDHKTPNLLLFSVHFNTLRKRFKLRHLLNPSGRTYLKFINGVTSHNHVLSDIRKAEDVDIKFKYKKQVLDAKLYQPGQRKPFGNIPLSVGDSFLYALPDFDVTILFLNRESTKWGSQKT